MDWDVIDRKLDSLQRCISRVREKCPTDAATLARDYDAQDILALNLTRAVQLSADIAAHLVASTDLPPPDTMGQVFSTLGKANIISAELAERMVKAVGFRNLAVHNYDEINWNIVYAIAHKHISDFEDFAKAAISKR